MAEDRKSFVIKESENGGVNITDEVVAIILKFKILIYKN